MRGLDIAKETCITINTAGMMAIQHQVVDPLVGERNPSFVDFILCCMEDDDDDEDDGDDGDEAEDENGEASSPRRQPRLSGRTRVDAQGAARERASRAQTRELGRESDDDDDESSDGGDGGRSTRSSLPLFGSLVNSTAASLTASSPDGEGASARDGDGNEESPDTRWNAHKRRRPFRTFTGSKRQERPTEVGNPAPASTRARRDLHRQFGDGDKNEDDDRSESTNLLEDDGEDEDEDCATDMGASQPLDVTEVTSSPEQGSLPRRRRGERRDRDRDREDGCSSPELAYGRQDRL
jgi:hypothetical protein